MILISAALLDYIFVNLLHGSVASCTAVCLPRSRVVLHLLRGQLEPFVKGTYIQTYIHVKVT